MVVLTASMLRHAAVCDRRVWLDHREAAPDLSPVASYRTALGQTHEQDIQGPAETHHVDDWADGTRLTRRMMRAGVPVIQNAFLEANITPDIVLRGRPDRLTRARNGAYFPIEIKRYGVLDAADYVQLDLYCTLTGVTRGEFWLGQPVRRVTHVYNPQRLLNAVERALHVLSRDEPPVRIEKHCKECHWYTRCWDVARAGGDLALVSGLRRDSRDALRLRGIHTLDQLAALDIAELQTVHGIKSTASSIRAGAEALLRGEPVWHGALDPTSQAPGVMFDLETDPSTGAPWSLGWLDASGSHVALIGRAPSRQLPDGTHVHVRPTTYSAWEAMADALAATDSPIFHWTGYDSGVLRGTAPAHVRAALEPRLFDLHRAFSRAVRFPVDGTSLKRVAAYLGYRWRAYESWFAAWEDYRVWLRTGADDALERSLRYQMDDVIALDVVWRWLNASDTRA